MFPKEDSRIPGKGLLGECHDLHMHEVKLHEGGERTARMLVSHKFPELTVGCKYSCSHQPVGKTLPSTDIGRHLISRCPTKS